MKDEISRDGGAARDFTLVVNSKGCKTARWSARQDEILNDSGLEAARAAITRWPGYTVTPLHKMPARAAEIGLGTLHYKDEGDRFGLGSFKALGGAYAVARLLARVLENTLGLSLSMAEIVGRTHTGFVSAITVCCATDGNHGRSVAWGAQSFGARCVVFIHANVSEARKQAIEAFGAEVRRTAGTYDDSVREAQEAAARNGWYVVSDTSWPGYMEVPKDVMQGYELMASEAFDQLGTPPSHIFLQTGVGGMAAAVAALAKRRWGEARPTVVLADPELSACWLESYRAGRPTPVEGDLDTIMAGLACGEVSALAWEILEDHGDAVIALPDTAAIDEMRRLARPLPGDPSITAGESAVAGLAALAAAMSDEVARNSLGLDRDSRVLVFGTEGATDPDLYASLVAGETMQLPG